MGWVTVYQINRKNGKYNIKKIIKVIQLWKICYWCLNHSVIHFVILLALPTLTSCFLFFFSLYPSCLTQMPYSIGTCNCKAFFLKKMYRSKVTLSLNKDVLIMVDLCTSRVAFKWVCLFCWLSEYATSVFILQTKRWTF